MRGSGPILPKAELRPSLAASLWQIVNSVVPFAGLLHLMYLSLSVSHLLTLVLSIVAGGFLVRIFIIQHDCGHGSFFRSRRANNFTGWACSLVTLVPYFYWRKQHALHHATNGNLDKRGYGDMTLYTVKEYLKLSKFDRLMYRIYRNPVMFLLLGPALLTLINNRTVRDRTHSTRGERLNVHLTNLTIVGLFMGAGWLIGWGELAVIALPVIWMASGAGIWLFYVQHQFDEAYWKRNPEWSFNDAALHGSTYFKLPRLLQWFTGNIGFHHIHHLRVGLPNYRLQKVFESAPEYRDVHIVTIWSSLRLMALSLWDEEQGRLVSFREALPSASDGGEGGRRGEVGG